MEGREVDQTVRAPSLDRGLAWLNTDRPLRLEHELRGQIVVLDFWTYCCVNCMHILPDLAWLEHEYAHEPVVFIGVHSAKFTNEAQTGTIRQAILRYEIKHPVVVDEQMALWNLYTVRSWPTVVVIDPEGNIAGTVAGEGHRAVLDRTIAQLLEVHQAKGTLARAPLELRREGQVPSASGLAFPGKVCADGAGGRLFIADSNHNRIVIASLPDQQGRCRLLQTIGSGAVGRDDGPAAQATFNHPQGLALHRDSTLYVCDTENHLIRAIDLASGNIKTVLGTGEMVYDHAGGKRGAQQGINSPWDVCIEGSTLYVAMAGEHQIWRVDMPVGFARALAGSGRENIVDGPTETAALSQPSGICVLNGTIYFADSEVSAIRGIDLAAERVFTLIGEGLFSFGDGDGQPPNAKLQHPLGVAPWRNTLLVADTYNHKLKQLDPATRELKTLFGTGRSGTQTDDGKLMLNEPGGLVVIDDVALVADTNNHRIIRIDLARGAWCEVVIEGLAANRRAQISDFKSQISDSRYQDADADVIRLKPIDVPRRGELKLVFELKLPTGTHLNAEAPCHVRISQPEIRRTILAQARQTDRLPLEIRVPLGEADHEGPWRVTLGLTYCTDTGTALCIPAEVAWGIPVRPSDTPVLTMNLSAELRPHV
ncbi:MAG TPA: thioredoxin-like domain-containing protein [Phycisphaerae bacterium]